MLGNCEKMVGFSSSTTSTKKWPQDQVDETGLMASSGRVMEKSVQEQALKCPRCDSSNTKFCYYNNYSLTQPRHFCKACKRYWTRGGTLRDVPAGGGCRKNKRVKRPTSSADTSPAPTSTITTTTAPTSQIHVSNHTNHLFYGIPSNPSDIDHLDFPRFSRISNVETVPKSCTGYDLQPHMNALGLSFSSDGYINPTTQIQDMVTSNLLFSNYSLFGSSSTCTSTSPPRASFINSSLQQQNQPFGNLKETSRATNHFQALLPFEDLQMSGMGMKDVKIEEGNNRSSNKVEWNVPCQNMIEIGSLDPSLYWNSANVGAWPDLNNLGSSVTPLI
ncbi:hypothetical protein HHK36_003674 [Tetracentron sinense]|uniref:Dof zinc finger protein n=1 Tax=Tetracentron sinense TaxID=13715 RepID=A0A834ZSX7_TETSI|nr:hypothetical protein HHK36_003674 [Tetracentron sinense]